MRESGMATESERGKAWRSFVDLQNRHRGNEGLPPFDANLCEYPAMMAGFYQGHDAAAFVALAGRASTAVDYSGVTRITVVGPDGVAFEKYNLYPHGVELHLQDEGRTLKVFPA
jgi:hypothetical protein